MIHVSRLLASGMCLCKSFLCGACLFFPVAGFYQSTTWIQENFLSEVCNAVGVEVTLWPVEGEPLKFDTDIQ